MLKESHPGFSSGDAVVLIDMLYKSELENVGFFYFIVEESL